MALLYPRLHPSIDFPLRPTRFFVLRDLRTRHRAFSPLAALDTDSRRSCGGTALSSLRRMLGLYDVMGSSYEAEDTGCRAGAAVILGLPRTPGIWGHLEPLSW